MKLNMAVLALFGSFLLIQMLYSIKAKNLKSLSSAGFLFKILASSSKHHSVINFSITFHSGFQKVVVVTLLLNNMSH